MNGPAIRIALGVAATFILVGASLAGLSPNGGLDLSRPGLKGLESHGAVIRATERRWFFGEPRDQARYDVDANYYPSMQLAKHYADPHVGNQAAVVDPVHRVSTRTGRRIGDTYCLHVEPGFAELIVRSGLDVYKSTVSRFAGKDRFGFSLKQPVTEANIRTLEDIVLAAIKAKPKIVP